MAGASARIFLLGCFRVVVGETDVEVPDRAARVLALLAVHQRPVSRTRVAGELWPDVAENRAQANLRATMWRLPPGCRGLVHATTTSLAIADGVEVDLHRARSVVRDVLDGLPVIDGRQALLELLSRPLLPEWYDEWLAFERERTRQLHIHALERLGQRDIESGDALTAVDIGLALVSAEPLRESAHVLLMSGYLASGNRADARRSYLRYCDVLRRELDLDPAVSWEELVAATRAGHLSGALPLRRTP